jgi:hypothetical protein
MRARLSEIFTSFPEVKKVPMGKTARSCSREEDVGALLCGIDVEFVQVARDPDVVQPVPLVFLGLYFVDFFLHEKGIVVWVVLPCQLHQFFLELHGGDARR